MKLSKFIIALQMILIVGIFAFMERRDAEAQEIERLEQIIMIDSECGPTIDLSMPIERVQM